MIIQFENFQIKLDQIIDDNFNLAEFNGIEFNVLKLISEWFSGQDTFVFKTSGSTGRSKEISVRRKMIEYSTMATFNCIDTDRKIKKSLLCINPEFIGGAMVVFRAAIMQHDLYVIEPSSNPLKNQNALNHYDLASMVPLQYRNSENSKLNQIDHILIGGGPINIIKNSAIRANVYSTFGMTETVSHFALRRIEEDYFSTTGDTVVSINDDSSLNIKGTITDHQLLRTNDIVEVISDTKFKWLGRKDFIINSGGIKLNPESIEKKLSKAINIPYLISSLPDDHLGQKIILILEGSTKRDIDFSELSRFEMPKETISIPEIPKTTTGKIDRNKTEKLIKDKLL